MPRSRRAGNQAPPEGATVPSRRPEARARLRARRRAPRPHPHPRRARASPHRRLARPPARPALPPALIIAHAGIVDLAAMAENFAGRAGVFFDTSVWSASTPRPLPVGTAGPDRLRVRLPVRQAAELAPPRRAHGTCLGPRRPAASGAAPRHRDGHRRRARARRADRAARLHGAHPVTFLRIHQYLTMASTMLWMRHPSDSFGVIGLALNACDERSNGHRGSTEQIRSCSSSGTCKRLAGASADDEALHRRAQRFPPRASRERPGGHALGTTRHTSRCWVAQRVSSWRVESCACAGRLETWLSTVFTEM